MADYALIDNYLDVVTHHLSHRPDHDNLRDELADHLLESTDRAREQGMDGDSAQRQTLERFGDPSTVAALLAEVPTKGIDMIHTLGRAAGALALLAAVLWLVVILAGSFGLIHYLDNSWTQVEYLWQSIVQATAVAATSLALVGFTLRSVGRVDALAAIVIASCAFAFALSFAFAWAFLGWGTFLGVALAVTIARMSQTASRSVRALLLVLAPLVLVIGSFVRLQLAVRDGQFTSLDQSRIDLALFIAYAAVALVLAAGFALLGVHMRRTSVALTEPTAMA